MGFIPLIVALGGAIFLWLNLVHNSLKDKKNRLFLAQLRFKEQEKLFEQHRQQVLVVAEAKAVLTDILILSKQIENPNYSNDILVELDEEIKKILEKNSIEKTERELLYAYQQHAQSLLQVRLHQDFCQKDYHEGINTAAAKIPAKILGYR